MSHRYLKQVMLINGLVRFNAMHFTRDANDNARERRHEKKKKESLFLLPEENAHGHSNTEQRHVLTLALTDTSELPKCSTKTRQIEY
jgi:hypothetical protein